MATEQSLDIGTAVLVHRPQAGDRLASPHDGEALATMLHGIEEVGEASCCFGGCDLRHLDQIIRLWV